MVKINPEDVKLVQKARITEEEILALSFTVTPRPYFASNNPP
jgi:hypothetical protein